MLREHKLGRVPMRYMNFARAKLYELHAAAAGGSLTRYFRLGGGAKLKISVCGDDGYIKMLADECPPAISGLAEVNNLILVGDELRFNRFYAKGASDWSFPSSFVHNAASFVATRPGMFSGEMAGVVQSLLGQGQTIPYSPTFATTHGVYTAANGSKHIIEITSSGIYTWPMGVCYATEDQSGLGYVPRSSPRPADPVQIADASVVSAYYAMSPLFPYCGWAFSASGAKAANVLLTTSGSYYRSRIVTITISETDNAPSGASAAEASEGYMYWTEVEFVKVPDYDLGGVVAFRAYTNVVAPASNYTAPVHVWYQDEVQKVLWRVVDGSTSTESLDTPSPPTTTVTGSLGSWKTGSSQTYYKSGFESPALPTPKVATSYSATTVTRRIVDGPFTLISEFYDTSTVFFVDEPTTTESYGESGFDVAVIPTECREGVYHYRKRDRTSVNRTTGQQLPSGKCSTLGFLGTAYPLNSPFGCTGEATLVARGCRIERSPSIELDVYSIHVSGYETESEPTLCGLPNDVAQWCGQGGEEGQAQHDTEDYCIASGGGAQPDETVWQAVGYLNGETITLDVEDSDVATAWEHYDEENAQSMMGVCDYAGNIPAIYMNSPHPLGGAHSGDTLGQTAGGGAPYPSGEIAVTSLCFTGTP